MFRWQWRVVLAVMLGIPMGWGQPPMVAAQTAATYTVTVASAYLRDTPSPPGHRTYSVFQGNSYAITGRTSDSTWVRLAYTAATQGTWIRADFGTVTGSLQAVPVAAAAVSAAPVATVAPAAVVAATSAGLANLPFRITVASTYVRDAPNWQANRVASLFQNQNVRAIARDGSGQWVLLRDTGWVHASVGSLMGNIASLPVGGGANRAPAPEVAATVSQGAQVSQRPDLPAWIPTITPLMKAVLQEGIRRGRDPRIFTVAGDCNSEGYIYLHVLALEFFDLSDHGYLHGTLLQYRRSFPRESQAVNGGFNTASVQNPLWANPAVCQRGETPFACELRLSRASIVFILLGTGDQHTWESFEANYRGLIEHALLNAVLPVVVTKADQLESQEGGASEDYINHTIRRLAQEYEVPLFDMNLATRDMENRGLLEEKGNNFHFSAEAIGVHILGTLQTLYAINQP